MHEPEKTRESPKPMRPFDDHALAMVKLLLADPDIILMEVNAEHNAIAYKLTLTFNQNREPDRYAKTEA